MIMGPKPIIKDVFVFNKNVMQNYLLCNCYMLNLCLLPEKPVEEEEEEDEAACCKCLKSNQPEWVRMQFC